MNNQQQGQQIQIKINDETAKGHYANAMMVNHSKEEFVLDFMSIFGGQGVVNSRVVISPGHFKRVISALVDNLKKYEDQFGKIQEAKDLGMDKEIGFKG